LAQSIPQNLQTIEIYVLRCKNVTFQDNLAKEEEEEEEEGTIFTTTQLPSNRTFTWGRLLKKTSSKTYYG
jgi:hypothetical protein